MSQPTPSQKSALQKLQVVYIGMLSSVIAITLIGSLQIIKVQAVQGVSTELTQLLPGLGIFLLAIGYFVRGALLKKAGTNNPQQLLVAHVISLAMTEACAIFGLICSIMTADPSYSQYLGGAAVLTLIAAWPRS